MNQQRLKHSVIFLRTVVALIMLTHGVGRIYLGIVGGFGEFLTLKGFPLGFYLAWAITIFEIAGSVSIAVGYYVAPLAIIFALHLLCGIYLVHLKDGWFVVGAGRNGAEFSVLLVASFITLVISHFGKNR
jgi:putative oxidoreductase